MRELEVFDGAVQPRMVGNDPTLEGALPESPVPFLQQTGRATP
jgi:hypothetical protein